MSRETHIHHILKYTVLIYHTSSHTRYLHFKHQSVLLKNYYVLWKNLLYSCTLKTHGKIKRNLD